MTLLLSRLDKQKPAFCLYPVIIFGLLLTPLLQAKPFTFFSRIDAFADSRPVAIAAFIDDWKGDFSRGSSAVAFNWIESGIRTETWSLSRIWRQDYYLQFHPDTAEFYYKTENKQNIDVGRHYRIDLSIKHNNSQGIRLQHKILKNSKFHAAIGVSYLKFTNLFYGNLTGEIIAAESEQDYRFNNVLLDYVYFEDKLMDREVQAPQGIGYTFDFNFSLQMSHRIKFETSIIDFFSKIKWQNAPSTQAILESKNKKYDSDGNIKLDPTFSGKHNLGTFNQILPPRINMLLYYKVWHAIDFSTELLITSVNQFYTQSIYYWLSKTSKIGINYQINTKSLGFAFSHSWLSIAISTDQFDLDQAKNIRFNTQIEIPLGSIQK